MYTYIKYVMNRVLHTSSFRSHYRVPRLEIIGSNRDARTFREHDKYGVTRRDARVCPYQSVEITMISPDKQDRSLFTKTSTYVQLRMHSDDASHRARRKGEDGETKYIPRA